MMEKLRVLDLFSGIGGFSLGLERTGGFETVAFCEIEEFPRRVLAKHWPEVPCYHDVRTLTAETLERDGIGADVITGGFPCQDISVAGHGEGIDGERSGLWSEIARLVGEVRPQFVIVENSAALLFRGMDRVLGDLSEIGYDAEWECVPAAAVGAPHIRDRVWILAYPRQVSESNVWGGWRCEDLVPGGDDWHKEEWRKDRELIALVPGIHPRKAANWWRHQSSVARTADGLPGQLDRAEALGNAVVPQIPEMIGCAILEAERQAA